MDRFFSIFGKIVLAVFCLAIILGAGYYVGHNKIIQPSLTAIPQPTNPPIVKQVDAQPSDAPLTTIPTEKITTKTLTGGLESGTSFQTYSLKVPEGWIEKRDVTPGVIDKLTLSKDTYTLTIYQAAIGGGGCTYKGDGEQPMSQTFADFVDITGENAQYRRSWNDEGKEMQSYTICQKGTDTYGAPTQFGAISYTTPKNVDTAVLTEMDSIVSSLKKQ